MGTRTATIDRQTGETSTSVTLDLDGSGDAAVETGIGFLDHLLTTVAVHGGFDVDLECDGDLDVDDHHTAEDSAIALGRAFDGALGDRRGIARFGDAHVPMDEALARAVIDFSGRPHAEIDLGLDGHRLGELATENVGHVLRSIAINANATLHVDVIRGTNNHHRAEAAFKAFALALARAVEPVDDDRVPSTKGTLE